MRIRAYQILILLLFGLHPCKAQTIDSLAGTIENIPHNFLSKIQRKYASIGENLSKKNTKYLQKMQRQEKKMQRKAKKVNPGLGITSASHIDSTYSAFISGLSMKGRAIKKVSLNQYIPYADTVSTALSFLQKYKSLEDKVKLPTEAFDKLKEKLNI